MYEWFDTCNSSILINNKIMVYYQKEWQCDKL